MDDSSAPRVGDRLDVVTHLDGLGSFAEELSNTVELEVDGVGLRSALALSKMVITARPLPGGRLFTAPGDP